MNEDFRRFSVEFTELDNLYCEDVCFDYLPSVNQEDILFSISAVNFTYIDVDGTFLKYSNYQPADGLISVCVDLNGNESYFDESFSQECPDSDVILKFTLDTINENSGNLIVTLKNNIDIYGLQFNLLFGDVSIHNTENLGESLITITNNISDSWGVWEKSPTEYKNLMTLIRNLVFLLF